MKKLLLFLAVILSALTASAASTTLRGDRLFEQSVPAKQTQNTFTITGANIKSVSTVSSEPSEGTVSVNGMNVSMTYSSATSFGVDDIRRHIYYGDCDVDPRDIKDLSEFPARLFYATNTEDGSLCFKTERKFWKGYLCMFVPASLSNFTTCKILYPNRETVDVPLSTRVKKMTRNITYMYLKPTAQKNFQAISSFNSLMTLPTSMKFTRNRHPIPTPQTLSRSWAKASTPSLPFRAIRR